MEAFLPAGGRTRAARLAELNRPVRFEDHAFSPRHIQNTFRYFGVARGLDALYNFGRYYLRNRTTGMRVPPGVNPSVYRRVIRDRRGRIISSKSSSPYNFKYSHIYQRIKKRRYGILRRKRMAMRKRNLSRVLAKSRRVRRKFKLNKLGSAVRTRSWRPGKAVRHTQYVGNTTDLQVTSNTAFAQSLSVAPFVGQTNSGNGSNTWLLSKFGRFDRIGPIPIQTKMTLYKEFKVIGITAEFRLLFPENLKHAEISAAAFREKPYILVFTPQDAADHTSDFTMRSWEDCWAARKHQNIRMIPLRSKSFNITVPVVVSVDSDIDNVDAKRFFPMPWVDTVKVTNKNDKLKDLTFGRLRMFWPRFDLNMPDYTTTKVKVTERKDGPPVEPQTDVTEPTALSLNYSVRYRCSLLFRGVNPSSIKGIVNTAAKIGEWTKAADDAEAAGTGIPTYDYKQI